ncbi:D-aminoacyl-tRNA deacylase [Scrofimicrobium sp. R131]|uniref:D-aminoacyl-tRNA deacylase n=1 Tax=Scrofimicrobium appendicitidis TaxID=3079930 RepID=A0AAU7V763_9ACTO
MRAVLQRARGARVEVAGQIVGQFDGEGVVALVGVAREDTVADAQTVARKIAELRILTEERSPVEAGAPVLVISQFTLYGSTKKGRRPSWSAAAPGEVAEPLVQTVVEKLRQRGVAVETGIFGAQMEVSLTNSGPFTVLVET